jgi:hypothetical protein
VICHQEDAFGHEGGIALSTHSEVSDTSLEPRPHVPQVMSVGWALRRTALWLVMMFAMVVVGMSLFYASIDPDEATAGPASSGETTQTTQ